MVLRVPTIYVSEQKFYYIKVGFKGVKTIKACFRDVFSSLDSCQACPSFVVFFASIVVFCSCESEWEWEMAT